MSEHFLERPVCRQRRRTLASPRRVSEAQPYVPIRLCFRLQRRRTSVWVKCLLPSATQHICTLIRRVTPAAYPALYSLSLSATKTLCIRTSLTAHVGNTARRPFVTGICQFAMICRRGSEFINKSVNFVFASFVTVLEELTTPPSD